MFPRQASSLERLLPPLRSVPMGQTLAKTPFLSLLIGSWTYPLGAAICSDGLGVSPSAILDSIVFARAPICAGSVRRAARRIGLLGLRGRVALGMATPWAAWTSPLHDSYKPLRKLCST